MDTVGRVRISRDSGTVILRIIRGATGFLHPVIEDSVKIEVEENSGGRCLSCRKGPAYWSRVRSRVERITAAGNNGERERERIGAKPRHRSALEISRFPQEKVQFQAVSMAKRRLEAMHRLRLNFSEIFISVFPENRISVLLQLFVQIIPPCCLCPFSPCTRYTAIFYFTFRGGYRIS